MQSITNSTRRNIFNLVRLHRSNSLANQQTSELIAFRKHGIICKNSSIFRRHMNTKQNHSSPNWKNNGTPEIIIGTTIITLLGVDYYLQKQQDQSRQEIINALDIAIKRDEARETKAEIEGKGKDQSTEKLFECVVRRIPKYFDGSKCLMGVEVGDRLSVLEERVGPDGSYHLCKLERLKKNGVGWFPMSCLEKIN